MSANINVIHDDIKLYTSADRFFLEPTINPQEILILDRITSEATVLERTKVQLPVPASVYRPVCGFLGTVKLLAGTYLVVATHRIPVGKLNGHEIYQLAGADLIPFSRSETHLNPKQIEDNESYIRMMKSVLETPGIYFSYSYDLTHTLQRLQEAGQDFPQMSLLVRADPRFVWNGHLLKGYRDKQFARFSLPIIQGFVSINSVLFEAKEFVWALVSRRSVQRAGTRLFTRGIDSQGYVANYVETEQLVERDAQLASFVQTRGSVPLYWRQLPDLRYKPAVELSAADHVAACTRHLADQIQRYGAQVLVNLIDQRGKEEGLERAYRNAVAASGLPRVRYEAFDFHAECRAMRYDRLSVLIDRVSHEQDEFAYFMSRNGVTLSHQTGVFRTNCVDCLDRTNVVQSLLARRALTSALRVLRVFGGERSVERCPELTVLFNGVWADHADMISMQYSGTGALKTDFTRTGKRTKLGLLNDGMNSLTRYYKNNFCDGFRQDSIDLFLGNYMVSDGEGVVVPCPLRKNKDWKYTTFPSVLLVAASMFCASVILPSEYSKEILLYLLFWGAMVGTTLSFIFKYGKEFVDYPKLEHSPTLRAVNTSASGL